MARIIVDASKRPGIFSYLKELIAFRELLITLAFRDFKIRYTRTLLGITWAFLQPLFILLVFAFLFNQVLEIKTGEIPYLVFAFSGLWIWNYFAFVVSNAGSALINYRNVIQKVYFPRLILPLSKGVLGLGDLCINAILLIALMLVYQTPLKINIVFLPLILLLLWLFSVGLGIWISALSIQYRDLQALMPFLLQVGIYLTPIAYPDSLIPDNWKVLYFFNPLAGLINGVRWSLFGEPFLHLSWISFCVALLIFISGFLFFRRFEYDMVDVL